MGLRVIFFQPIWPPNALIIAGAAASLAAGMLGHSELQLSMLGAAALGGVQAAATWSTLQQRLKVRYSLW